MRIKCLILIVICFFFAVGCSGQKDIMTEYLEKNDYLSKGLCYQKSIPNGDGNVVQRFCLDECMYYAMDSQLDDYFTLDIENQSINYIYDYISYQYDMKDNHITCFFQGEEIDDNSSYCKIAKQIVDQHLKRFQEELKHANVKMKSICK